MPALTVAQSIQAQIDRMKSEMQKHADNKNPTAWSADK